MDEIGRLARQGRFFITRHALKRLKERNFTQSDVKNALVKGVSFPDSQDGSKVRTVCKLGQKCLTLSVLVKKVLVIKSCWESKRWEREAYEKEVE
ncbi:MAG: DUF4258 domain-containing protein [Candidatus Diapherotrites archaeon]|nr:DUF4258 domain-containing protein [Candidatus Diapherotrites archaeon]